MDRPVLSSNCESSENHQVLDGPVHSFRPTNPRSRIAATANSSFTRRQFLATTGSQCLPAIFWGTQLLNVSQSTAASAHSQPTQAQPTQDPGTAEAQTDYQPQIDKGLRWLSQQQSRLGGWPDPTYEVAISALSGLALICSGSTTVQGPYANEIRLAVDFLINRCRDNGLIGNPARDNRYTYGHGFSMLFLSQVLGEEEDADRRQTLRSVLQRAVTFSVSAQTRSGGWGYVSAKDGNDFDEGSTTITQVQGLRGCRNAGIAVSGEAIDRAKKYIYDCKNDDGGISYSSSNRGSSRPAITAAALAALYNAGDYDSQHVPEMLEYCKKNLDNISSSQYGHWHYTYLYYSQVMYRQSHEQWMDFRSRLMKRIFSRQMPDGQWPDEQNGETYSTACNLIMAQMDYGYLPIFQR